MDRPGESVSFPPHRQDGSPGQLAPGAVVEAAGTSTAASTDATMTASLREAWEGGYERGHADSARDIFTNASAHAESLRHELEVEHAREVDAQVAAVREKYERLMKALLEEKEQELADAKAVQPPSGGEGGTDGPLPRVVLKMATPSMSPAAASTPPLLAPRPPPEPWTWTPPPSTAAGSLLSSTPPEPTISAVLERAQLTQHAAAFEQAGYDDVVFLRDCDDATLRTFLVEDDDGVRMPAEDFNVFLPILRARAPMTPSPSSTAHASQDAVPPELMRRVLAFRQYLEVKRMGLGSKATKSWKLTVRRQEAVDAGGGSCGLLHAETAGGIEHTDVLRAFHVLYDDPKRKRSLLFCNTVVSFIDAFGVREEGEDLGGLTTEMFSRFWSAILAPEARLFEPASDEAMGGVLPRADAPEADMEALGLVLIKCIMDDHPIGHGLCGFVIDYLVHFHEASALCGVHAALRALRDFDRALADSWSGLLEHPERVDDLGLTVDAFDATALAAPVRADNLATVVHQGCVSRLLGTRHAAFSALRRGFQRCEDLSVQLAALGSAESLCLLLQGRQSLSTAELLECIEWPSHSYDAEMAAGFAAAGSRVPELLGMLLQDETVFDEPRRFAMLRWCTALHALPVGGLREDRIKIRLFGAESDNSTLPETHTCTRELHLPNYTRLGVLREKLLLALEHADDGFGKE